MKSSSEMKLQPETEGRAAEALLTRNCQPCESVVCDLGDCDHDVMDIIMRLVGIHTYLSVASISTRWRHAWGQKPRVTSSKWAVQSCSCLDWARASGLDTSNKPCLLAAAEGRLDVLQHAVALGYSREGMPICERAAAEGHLKVVKWCRANGYPWGLSKLLAAEGGHLEVLQWCIASNAPAVSRTSLGGFSIQGGVSETAVLKAAVKGGHLETTIWCWQQVYRSNKPWIRGVPDLGYLAAKGGHLELLKWLRGNGCSWSLTGYEMIEAVVAGDLDMLEWCRANGCRWARRIQPRAIMQGNLEIVKWSVANDPQGRINVRGCCYAAAHGHLDVVQWLREMGYPWVSGVCFSAANGGHFEVLKWCIANGCPWGNVSRDEGSKFHGTVTMMVWASENGCPWMTDRRAMHRICWYAARGGNLEVLKWCATNHRISGSKYLETVARNGHMHVLEWLRANTGELERSMYNTTSMCAMAASSGSLETVEWCRANGYPWCLRTCAAAATSGNLELLQWCRANGCPWGNDTCNAVIRLGDFEMLAWCRENGCPPDRKWKESSLSSGHAEMIEWCWEPLLSESRHCRPGAVSARDGSTCDAL